MRVDTFMRMNITSYRYLSGHEFNDFKPNLPSSNSWREPIQVYEFFYEDGPRLMEPGLRGDETKLE